MNKEISVDEKIKYFANKIIVDGLEDCSEFHYDIPISEYDDFVDKYQNEIIDIISKDVRVTEAYIDRKFEPTLCMCFGLDYCPYYYETNDLHPQIERTYLKMFIDKIKEIEEFIHIRTTRDLVRQFMNSYVENDYTLDFDDKDGIYYSLKEHICNTGFNEKYIDKYEVYVNKNNIHELINLLENELEKMNEKAYVAIEKISLDKVREMLDKIDNNKKFDDNELNCFICEDNNIYLCVDNTSGEMIMQEFDAISKCLDYIGRKDFYCIDAIEQYRENQEEEMEA